MFISDEQPPLPALPLQTGSHRLTWAATCWAAGWACCQVRGAVTPGGQARLLCCTRGEAGRGAAMHSWHHSQLPGSLLQLICRHGSVRGGRHVRQRAAGGRQPVPGGRWVEGEPLAAAGVAACSCWAVRITAPWDLDGLPQTGPGVHVSTADPRPCCRPTPATGCGGPVCHSSGSWLHWQVGYQGHGRVRS